ncbi:MAG: BolA family transcriptional regulator [Gammaproteobacteria bacterium]|nr:BolA family transcriptional regulator [Gammaproteobacteria bacterium]
MQPEEIRRMIEQGIPGAEARVDGDGRHFEAVVITDAFDGRGTLQRHRMVYAALGDRMGGDIHALSLRTYTPDEWSAAGGG